MMDKAQAKVARLQAQANGENKYTGIACNVCRGTQHYTIGNACVLCAKARTRARQVASPEKQRKYHEQWRCNNRDYLRAYYKVQKLRAKEQQPCY